MTQEQDSSIQRALAVIEKQLTDLAFKEYYGVVQFELQVKNGEVTLAFLSTKRQLALPR